LTGGLILFARNWRDRRQLTDLAAEVKSIGEPVPIHHRATNGSPSAPRT